MFNVQSMWFVYASIHDIIYIYDHLSMSIMCLIMIVFYVCYIMNYNDNDNNDNDDYNT